MGALFKRGNIWWLKYYRNGKNYRESSKSGKKMVAKKLLDRREGEISQGKIPGVLFEKVFFDELAEDFLRDYRVNRKKSVKRAQQAVNHLKRYFEGMRIVDITTPVIQDYIEKRMTWTCKKCSKTFDAEVKCPYCGGSDLKAGAANGTINRELSALKRMLNMGAKQTPPKVDRVPYIPMLKENNIRKGFFEYHEFLFLREALPDYLKGFVTFAYRVGWRVSELINLEWRQVDRHQGIVRLETGETKNDEARTVYLDSELMEVFNKQWENRKEAATLTPYVFPNPAKTGRISDFRASWNTACKDAEIGKKYFHDFRRTAVRNMIRSGIPERVAMMISGHKTRAVFDRYNIVNDADLKLAAQRQEAYLKSLMGTISGTIRDFGTKKGVRQNS